MALLPWFVAGSFFPITSMPNGLTWIARALPVTHAVAPLRYGLVDQRGQSLRDICGMHSTTAMAAPSLTIVLRFAAVVLAGSVVLHFTRSAVH